MEKCAKAGVNDIANFPELESFADVFPWAKEYLAEYKNNQDSRIVIMAGHAMPFALENRVYLSLHSLVPDEVLSQMKAEKMLTFSEETFSLGAQVASALKAIGFNVKLLILINDITHVWDAYSHPANIKPNSSLDPRNKDADKIHTMDDLRRMLLADFYSDQKLPAPYLQALKENDLGLDDVLSYKVPVIHLTKGGRRKEVTQTVYCVRELTLQNNFDRFTEQSPLLKVPFGKKRNVNEEALLSFMANDPILKGVLEEIKFCAQKDTPNMPGGIDCSKEMISLYASVFGVREGVSNKVPLIYQPKEKFSLNAMITFIPMGCRNAVYSGSVINHHLLHPTETDLSIINIPFASNAKNSDFQLLNGLRDR